MEIKQIKKAGRLAKKTNESEKSNAESTMKRKNKRDLSQRPTYSNVTSKENTNIL